MSASGNVLDEIPVFLEDTLVSIATSENDGQNNIILSSRTLANRFISSRWGIRSSQRRRYLNLFSSLQKHCRILFDQYLASGKLEWADNSGKHLFGVHEISGRRQKHTLGFVPNGFSMNKVVDLGLSLQMTYTTFSSKEVNIEFGKWSFLHQVAMQFGTDCRIQQDILYALGLGKYGLIDLDIREVLLSFPPDATLESLHERMNPLLVDAIATAVDKGGATTGLNLEEMHTQHGEIAQRIHQIIELRKLEIQRVQVEEKEDMVDLRELWLTAYGYEICSALGLQLTTDFEGFEQVKNAASELGFDLKTGETSVSGVKMSDELKQAIWWVVENRGQPWHKPSSTEEEYEESDPSQ